MKRDKPKSKAINRVMTFDVKNIPKIPLGSTRGIHGWLIRQATLLIGARSVLGCPRCSTRDPYASGNIRFSFLL